MKQNNFPSDWPSLPILVCLLFSIVLSPLRVAASGPPPVITVQPLSSTVPVLGTTTLGVVAVSATTMSYQWQKNGNNIQGATGSSYVVATTSTNASGVYAVQVSNSGGTVSSSNATVMVLLPPAITLQPQSLTALKHNTAAFSVTATGSAPLHYQWFFNGSAVSGSTNAIMTLTKIQNKDAGNYVAVITNAVGSVTSSVAALTEILSAAVVLNPSGLGGKVAGKSSLNPSLSFAVPSGVTYVIQNSADLANWNSVLTNTATATSTNVNFTDTSFTNCAQRFYRVMLPD